MGLEQYIEDNTLPSPLRKVLQDASRRLAGNPGSPQDLTVTQLQTLSQIYDDTYWQHNGFDEKLRHITLHMGKLLGKLAEYCENKEHAGQMPPERIASEVMPDLLFYSLQLANLFEKRLEVSYILRLGENIKRQGNY